MPAKSLKKLATASAISGIKYLYDVGECPYDLVQPILMRLGNPQQLYEIEKACPQIAAEDEEVWRSLIIRDFSHGEAWLKERDGKLKVKAAGNSSGKESKTTNWWKVYQRIKKEADDAAADHAASFKAVLDKEKKEKESRRTTIDPKLRMSPSRTTSAPKTLKTMSILQKARREESIAIAGRKFTDSPSGMLQQSPMRTVLGRDLRQTPQSSSRPDSTSVSATAAESKEDAQARRERALTRGRAAKGMTPYIAPATPKRIVRSSSPFMPKRRRLV